MKEIFLCREEYIKNTCVYKQKPDSFPSKPESELCEVFYVNSNSENNPRSVRDTHWARSNAKRLQRKK